jgi:hypothetical protein
MTPQQYEAAFLAQTAFKLSVSNSFDEFCAVACTIRNHVIPRPGQIATYKSFPEACIDFLKAYPAREEPLLVEDALIAPGGLLAVIEGIWDCSYPDITATQTTPGARMFGRASAIDSQDWRYPLIRSSTLLGSWGSQQFFHY